MYLFEGAGSQFPGLQSTPSPTSKAAAPDSAAATGEGAAAAAGKSPWSSTPNSDDKGIGDAVEHFT